MVYENKKPQPLKILDPVSIILSASWLLYGLILILPLDTFSKYEYEIISKIVSENFLGIIFIALGLYHLCTIVFDWWHWDETSALLIEFGLCLFIGTSFLQSNIDRGCIDMNTAMFYVQAALSFYKILFPCKGRCK